MIFSNLYKDPLDEKYHLIKFSNLKIQEFISKNEECINFLQLMNFKFAENSFESQCLKIDLDDIL